MLITKQIELDADELLELLKEEEPNMILDCAIELSQRWHSCAMKLLDYLATDYPDELVNSAFVIVDNNPKDYVHNVCSVGLTDFIAVWIKYKNTGSPMKVFEFFLDILPHMSTSLEEAKQDWSKVRFNQSELSDLHTLLCSLANDLKQLLDE